MIHLLSVVIGLFLLALFFVVVYGVGHICASAFKLFDKNDRFDYILMCSVLGLAVVSFSLLVIPLAYALGAKLLIGYFL